jgi:hypothetical protein
LPPRCGTALEDPLCTAKEPVPSAMISCQNHPSLASLTFRHNTLQTMTWSAWCSDAASRPLHTLVADAYATGGLLVNCAPFAALVLTSQRNVLCIRAPHSLMFCLQISFFFLSAVVQGVAHVRWRVRVRSEVEREKEWKLFGVFSAISCLGCISGILAYAPRMCQLTHRYRP